MAMSNVKRASGKTTAKNAKKAGNSKKSQDAIALLRSDHQEVSALFGQFEKARTAKRKGDLAAKICTELTVHAQIEEEILYPAFAAAIKDKSLVPEATVEHQSMKDLIGQIQSHSPDDALFEAKVTVLGEYVKHHVKEEQNEMFPKARKSKLDLKKLGEELRVRKEELMATHG